MIVVNAQDGNALSMHPAAFGVLAGGEGNSFAAITSRHEGSSRTVGISCATPTATMTAGGDDA